jgi:hypothetical protein
MDKYTELEQCIRSALAGTGGLYANYKTRANVSELAGRKDIPPFTKDDLTNAIYIYCVEERKGKNKTPLLERYDPDKCTIQTYINSIVLRYTCNMLRQGRLPITHRYDTVLEGVEIEGEEETYTSSNFGDSDIYCRNTITPEDLLLLKEDREHEENTLLKYHNEEITALEGAERLEIHERTFYRRYNKFKDLQEK